MKQYIYRVEYSYFKYHSCDCEHCEYEGDGRDGHTIIQVCGETEPDTDLLEIPSSLFGFDLDEDDYFEITAITLVEERNTLRGFAGEIRLVEDVEEERAREAAHNPIDFDNP